jgi:hypothetical protein
VPKIGRKTSVKLAGAAARGVMKPLRNVLKNGNRIRVLKRVVPPGVKRLPSGRFPANYRFAGRRYNGPGWTAKLQRKYPDGVWFSKEGFPNFGPHADKEVTFPRGFLGNRTSDFVQANKLADLPRTPRGMTWHHVEDLRTMQLVPTDLHDAIRHAGGVALMKGR